MRMREKKGGWACFIATLLMCSLLVFSACGETHEHYFVDGKCECGAIDENYEPPHEHSFIDGKCECGAIDENYEPPHEHSFIDGKCECGAVDLIYLRAQAVAVVQEYAETELSENILTDEYEQSVWLIVSNEASIIETKETAEDIEAAGIIACYRIDLIVLKNNRDAAILAVINECDPNIESFANMLNSFSSSDIFWGTETQYKQEISVLERQIIDARSEYTLAVKRYNALAAESGLAGYYAGLIDQAEKEMNAIISKATNQKEELERLWANKELYLECLSLYQSWVDYKEYYLQDINTWYENTKSEIEGLIADLQ